MKKNIGLIASIFLLLNACSSNTSNEVNNISNQKKIGTEKKVNVLLVDVRTKEEFNEGSVSNAINIPLNEIENKLVEFKTDKKIVVFCRSGNRSHQAKIILQNYNITNVVDGGAIDNVKNMNFN